MSAPSWLEFDWDDANTEHIARHHYTPEEVEEVFAGSAQVRKLTVSRYAAYGATADGRMTVVIFERRRGSLRVVTAREMTEKERRSYRRK